MRPYFTKAFVLAASMALCQAAAAQPPPPAPPAQQFDVPTDKPQTVMILTRDFAPGQTAGRHLHHGVEMTMVMHGSMELMVDGQPAQFFHAGQSFIVPREAAHDVKNVGTDTLTIAVTYVIDKGMPARVPVP
jgi:quercetin dioxygenase-like cupin family protein